MGFTLDTNAARKAELGKLEPGKQIGQFTKAMAITSKEGAKGVEFDFENMDGQKQRRIQIWTHNKKGEPIQGLNHINALMVCLGVDAVEEKQIEADVWDDVAKQVITDVVPGYPAFMGKKIGLLLQQVISEYEGREFTKLSICYFFCPNTGRMASEILDKKPEGTTLPKLEQWLSQNLIKDERKKSSIPQPVQKREVGQSQATSAIVDDFDDDIPF